MNMPFASIYCIILLSLLSLCASSQTGIVIPDNINLPRDSATRIGLISSLNGFLEEKEQPNKENTWVEKDDLLETSALLDEIKGMEINKRLKNKTYYKPYLTNIIQLDSNRFLIQFAYLGSGDSIPELRANFKILARRTEGRFHFCSPLESNTASWKTTRIGNVQFHYKDQLNDRQARLFMAKTEEYDKRLMAPSRPLLFYCCDNAEEVLQILGVEYKSDYNGRTHISLSSNENDSDLVIDGLMTSDFLRFDPHDLWHSRLHKMLSVDSINRPVDEGCAYLYGGSWGIPWDQVLQQFTAYAAAHPHADWLDLYDRSVNFGTDDRQPMNTDYVINALLVQKIEKEKGFHAVMELLSCGKKEKDNANYFKALEKITGIKKADFSAQVWLLVKAIPPLSPASAIHTGPPTQ